MYSAHRFLRHRVYLALAGLAVLTLFILACGDDATPTPTQGPAATSTPTSAPDATATPTATLAPGETPRPTATATARPGPTATPTSPASQIAQARLRIALPPATDQFTVPYPNRQVSEKLMPEYSHLVGRNIQTNVEEPQLATSWSVLPDGKTWTFNLRDDVPFYKNGEPLKDYTLSPQDVFLSFDLLIGEEGNIPTKNSRSPGNWNQRLGFPSGWVANGQEITLNLPGVNLDLSFLLSDEWESGIMSRDHWDDVGGEDGYMDDPVGNGPWTFISHEIGTVFLHERVEDHWRVTPDFHELEFIQVKESATRLAMLLAKEADIIPLIRTQRQLVESAGFRTFRSTLPSIHQGIGFIFYREFAFCSDDGTTTGNFDPNGEPPPGGNQCGPSGGWSEDIPLRDPLVRKAMSLAINRNEINDVFYQGKSFPLVDYFPPWRDDFQDRWAPFPGPEGKTGAEGGWPYPGDGDLAQARDLLAQAGFPNGFDTTLNCLETHQVVPEWPDICEALAGYWDAIGVNVSLEPNLDFGSFRSLTRTREHHGGNYMWTASPSLDPICQAVTFSMIWELGQAYREFPEASDFYFECQGITSLDVRRDAAIEFADTWLDQTFSIPLMWVFAEVAVNPDVVAEYEVNMLHMGPVRYHERTKAVFE